jgi:hypothetical protein
MFRIPNIKVMLDAKFYHHGVTQQSHHGMENRGSPQQILRADGPRPWTMALWKYIRQLHFHNRRTYELLRDVLTLFQNGDLYLGGEYLLI